MMASKFIIYFFTLIVLTSCGKTNSLEENDFKWIPYKGNEVLVFSSNTGDTDTIFLTGANRQTVSSDPLDAFPAKLEQFTITAKHTDPSSSDGNHRYLENLFLQLSTSKHNSPYLTLNHTGKDAWFYGGGFMEIKDLDTIRFVSLATKYKAYYDVILLYPESNEYLERSNFITKEYWSKSEGLIRYDKKGGVYWELARKYSQ